MPPRRENFFVTLVKTWAKASVISVTVAAVLVVACVVLLVVLVAVIGSAVSGGLPGTIQVGDTTATFAAGDADSENILLSVPVSGLILGQSDGSEGGFFGGEVTYGYDVKAVLEDAADIEDVRGVVLDITSGGGTIYGSMAISDGVDRYREKAGRPVVSFVEGIAASGAYWAAASTDEIFVDHGSSVGSIGVIYGPFQFFDRPVAFDGGLLGGGIVTQNGISVTYFTAGRGKDMGNPFRPLTNEEISIAQTGVNNEYENFVAHVSEARDIPVETIKTQIGAYVYDNKTATGLGLMDETANRDETYAQLAEDAGIRGDDWAVYAVDTPGAGLSLFGGSIGGDGTAGKAEPECRLYRQYLAYFGDVSALCLRRED